jgi:ketosteroid isomerase-like protein
LSSPARREPTAVERIFIALIGGEPEAVLDLVHPQVEWTPTHWSGEQTYRGREGVRRWLDQFGGALEYLDHRVERMQSEDDRGAVQATVFDSREGVMFAVRVAWSFELEEGLLRRGRAHDSWEEALSAAALR